MKLTRGKVQYRDVLNLPPGRQGEFEVALIRYPPGHEFLLANARTTIVGGHKAGRISWPEETIWHELREGSSRWMSDYPIEQVQADNEVAPLRAGSVLVGGLGLGYVATVLAKRPRIKRVVVVEKSADVIDLVAPYLCQDDQAARSKLTFIHMDLFDYLHHYRHMTSPDGVLGLFTHAYYDIWRSDGEYTFFHTVLPLKHLSRGVVRTEPICWNESVMRGQLFHGLTTRAWLVRTKELSQQGAEMFKQEPSLAELCEFGNSIWRNWMVPYFRWYRTEAPRLHSLSPEDAAKVLEQQAGSYVSLYGRSMFQEMWRVLSGVTVTKEEMERLTPARAAEPA